MSAADGVEWRAAPHEAVIEFIDANRARFVDELVEWVRIPSISSDPRTRADVAPKRRAPRGATFAGSAPAASRCGRRAGHPAVFAEWLRAPGKPTLLVYGHHDVQPVDPLDEWISPPFEPAIRDGRLWGRGVVDDKGQVYIHVKAIESFIATAGRLPINLKLIVEGEEEIGSDNLDDAPARARGGSRGRLRLRERHGDVRARHPFALRRPARPRVPRGVRRGPARRPALGLVRRRRRSIRSTRSRR